MYGQEIKLYKTRTKVAHNYNLVSLELLLPTTTTADHDDKLLTPTAKTEGTTVQGENVISSEYEAASKPSSARHVSHVSNVTRVRRDVRYVPKFVETALVLDKAMVRS